MSWVLSVGLPLCPVMLGPLNAISDVFKTQKVYASCFGPKKQPGES